jgi:hypothetical protein
VTDTLRTVTLVGADGSRHVLACSAEPYQLKLDGQLWGNASYAFESRRVANLPGERLEDVHVMPRTFTVPIEVVGTTELDVDQRLAALGSILSPSADCGIIYRRADGSTRQITARCIAGADTLQAIARSGPTQRQVAASLVFRAYFPYWTSLDFDDPSYSASFNDALGAGFNSFDLTCSSDVETWPEVTITGPVQNIHGANLVTGQVWRIVEVLNPGQVVRIESDPRRPGVWLNDVYRFDMLDTASALWPLVPRLNRLMFRGTSVGVSPIGSFGLRWRNLHESC